MSDYPKTKYPASGGGSITVDGPQHEKSLGPGWQDHPPFVLPPPTPAEQMHQAMHQAEEDLRNSTGVADLPEIPEHKRTYRRKPKEEEPSQPLKI